MIRLDKNVDRSRHARNALPTQRMTVSIRSVRPVLGYLATQAFDPAEALRAVGVHGVDTDDPEARIPHETAVALWEHAERVSGDRNIGLHVAESIRPGMFGALEYAVQTCTTLGEGIERVVRYHRVLHDAAEVRLEVSGDGAALSHRYPLPGSVPRQVSEFILAAWLLSFRRIAVADWVPLAVRFPHAEPADISDHRRLFAAPLVFGCPRSELLIPRTLLDRPLPEADPLLRQAVEMQLSAQLESLPAAEAYTHSVQRLLAKTLNAGSATLDEVAARLHLSPRTLHRRLEEEGTSFRRIVSTVRRELAEKHLRDGRVMIDEIAFLLGYSEASAFHRAFKRWTGCSPQDFRSRARQAAESR